MDRERIHQEIREMFGLVPSFFQTIPDATLALEWRLFKRVQFEAGPIPNKYRELIGVAVAAVTRCRYCAAYHTELARLNGATEAEIEDAVHFAKSSAGWSTYLNGMQMDYDQFRAELSQACEYVRRTQEKRAA
jgi:AhpD family alkylhydroperoxidase